MSRILYIADTHFGHSNCLNFDSRPFRTIEEHDKALTANWNAVVMPGDTVYVIGDFAYKNTRPVSSYVSELHGHIHLIRGNHDKQTKEYESCFESVHDILVVRDTLHGYPCQVTLCHYWIPFDAEQKHGGFQLHGHTHISEDSRLEEQMKEKLRSEGIRCEAYNVGCMWQNYFPQTLEQIVARQGL